MIKRPISQKLELLINEYISDNCEEPSLIILSPDTWKKIMIEHEINNMPNHYFNLTYLDIRVQISNYISIDSFYIS